MKRLIAFLIAGSLCLPVTASAWWKSIQQVGVVSGASLACSYSPVTTGTQGTAYTGATPSASGGTPSYTFSETGTLPGGLSISSSTGIISGTPTANGSFPTIQVKVTDSLSNVANCGSAFTLVISPSGGTPTLTYIGTNSPTYAGNVATVTGASIGTAASDRLVVVVFMDFNSGGPGSTATATIGGVSATINTVTNSTNGNFAGIASLNVPTGTTATIAVTYGGTVGGFGDFEVYTITGLSSFTATGAGSNYDRSGTSPEVLSTNIATSSGGVIIAGGLSTSPPATVTNSGSTETFSQDHNPISIVGSTVGFVSHSTGISTNASSTVTADWTWTPGFSSFTLVAAAWR